MTGAFLAYQNQWRKLDTFRVRKTTGTVVHRAFVIFEIKLTVPLKRVFTENERKNYKQIINQIYLLSLIYHLSQLIFFKQSLLYLISLFHFVLILSFLIFVTIFIYRKNLH